MLERGPEPRTFVSGDASPGRRAWSRFVRMYRLPLGVTGLFLLVLGVLYLTSPGRPATAPERQTLESGRTSVPRTSPCVACPLGHTCDPVTGRCVLIDRSEIDCVRGTVYDEEEGYCVSTSTPRPARQPAAGVATAPPVSRATATPQVTPAPATPQPAAPQTPATPATPQPTPAS